MKEATQHYYLTVENPTLVEIGQAIMDGDTIIGFIADVIFDGRAEVVLWETHEFEFLDNMENISDSIENPFELFETAMGKASERVKNNWKETIKANE
jgi:hypothetical protein